MSRRRAWSALLFVGALAAAAGGCSNSGPPIMVSVSPSAPQAIDQGQTVGITATILNDNKGLGVTWSLSGPGTLSSTAGPSVTYTPPAPPLTSAQQAIVTATAVADRTKQTAVTIAVNPPPAIPFQNLPNGTVGVAYSQQISLTGGTSPFQWSVYDGPILTGWRIDGSLPDGLTLNTSTGVISGTPSAGGTWYFEAAVTDAAGVATTNGFMSIQILPTSGAGNAVPYVNQPLLPSAVTPGSVGFTLNVSGTGFASSATVNWNGKPLATTFVNASHLAATVPATLVANAGTATVTVVNPGPGGGASNFVYFPVGTAGTLMGFASAAIAQQTLYYPFGLVAGDFNEDGKADLAFSLIAKVNVFVGKGDGTFAPAAGSPVPIPSPPYDDFPSPYGGPLAVGDFNHSGHLGLAVGEVNNEAAVILLGDGSGAFQASTAAFANGQGMPASAIGVADFNADGNLDLALVNQISGVSPVVLGYGAGAFNQSGTLYQSGFANGVAIGDFNGDGKLDAVMTNGVSPALPNSALTVSLGNGDGTFTASNNSPIILGSGLNGIVAADFNGDGKLDLAVTDSGNNTVIVLLGNGDGTFGAPTTVPVGSNPGPIVAADFNNDGKLDLAVANMGDGTVTLLLGNGDGTFTPAAGSPYHVGGEPYQMVVGDFNGDGKLDLAVADIKNNMVFILLQQ